MDNGTVMRVNIPFRIGDITLRILNSVRVDGSFRHSHLDGVIGSALKSGRPIEVGGRLSHRARIGRGR